MSQATMESQQRPDSPQLYPASAPQPQAKANRPQTVDPASGKLTPKRPKREKDNLEYQKMMGRMIRAYTKRVVAEDPSTLAEMLSLRKVLDEAINEAALRLHDEKNYSWTDIAYEVGMTRQSAFLRWARRARRAE